MGRSRDGASITVVLSVFPFFPPLSASGSLGRATDGRTVTLDAEEEDKDAAEELDFRFFLSSAPALDVLDVFEDVFFAVFFFLSSLAAEPTLDIVGNTCNSEPTGTKGTSGTSGTKGTAGTTGSTGNAGTAGPSSIHFLT